MLLREYAVLVPFLGVFAVGVLAGLPARIPAAGTLWVSHQIVTPLLLIAGVQLAFYLVTRQRRYLVTARLLPLLTVGLALYLHFKVWTTLVNPRRYDELLLASDVALGSLTAAFVEARGWMAAVVGETLLDLSYHLAFILAFYVSIFLHAVVDTERGQARLLLGIALMLLAGGVSYWLMPAVGPFLFHGGGNELAHAVQQEMLGGLETLHATGVVTDAYFTHALAAMPSLHVGHLAYLAMCAAAGRRTYWLLGGYWILILYVIIEASVSGWHYLVDLPAGLLLAVSIFLGLSRWLPPEEYEAPP